MSFTIILSRDSKGGIGKDGDLAVKLKADMEHFKRTTMDARPGKVNAVIMGRLTWESLPVAHRPLEDRLNVVLSRQTDFAVPKGVLTFSTLDEALLQLDHVDNVDKVFVIGGAKVLAEALRHPECDRLVLTEIEGDFGCDVFFPAFTDKEFLARTVSDPLMENGVRFRFTEYLRTELTESRSAFLR